MSKTKYPIILASASPRRQQLMNEAGYEFTVIPATITEPSIHMRGAKAATYWAEALAYLKACSVACEYPEATVIGADTLVTYRDVLIGKPVDVNDARRILTDMFAGRNDVITGLAILCPAANKRVITHVTTTLIMRAMTNEELDDYLRSGAWRDKAGAYAYQEGGDKFVEQITGSESNVVGLPMEKLDEIFKDL